MGLFKRHTAFRIYDLTFARPRLPCVPPVIIRIGIGIGIGIGVSINLKSGTKHSMVVWW